MQEYKILNNESKYLLFNKLRIGFMVKKDLSILAVHVNLKLKWVFKTSLQRDRVDCPKL